MQRRFGSPGGFVTSRLQTERAAFSWVVGELASETERYVRAPTLNISFLYSESQICRSSLLLSAIALGAILFLYLKQLC